MGTNYYLEPKPACEACGREHERLHIGKSSGGWMFSLHVMPEKGINSLGDWAVLWYTPGAIIRNEYGEIITPEEMLSTITKREWGGSVPQRHKIDGSFCISHGSGTWDHIAGDFS